MDVNTRISSMYENIGYLGMYGKDVMVTILLFFITFIIVAYSSYKAVVSELRNNYCIKCLENHFKSIFDE